MTMTAQDKLALAEVRTKRFDDAFHLRRPDAIPVMAPFGNLLSELEGCTRKELYDDPERAQAALERWATELQPDFAGSMFFTPNVSRALGDTTTKWPGYGLGDNESYQFHEQEILKPEDYAAFNKDPSDFALRKFLPRAYSELAGLALLPPMTLSMMGLYSMIQNLAFLQIPPVVAAFAALAKASEAHAAWAHRQAINAQRMRELGFARVGVYGGSYMLAPFDFLSDTLRGMRGIFADMRRCPNDLLQAQDRLIDIQVEQAVMAKRTRGTPYAFLPTHRGSDGFMSLKDFEKFYWPQLETLILRLIDADITPYILWEGKWDQRLAYLKRLPKGKTIGQFQDSDIFRVKEELGDVMCIVGGMPVSLLFGGTVQEIDARTERLCKEIGAGGGFVMFPSIGELQGCKWELIKAWVDATRRYGV